MSAPKAKAAPKPAGKPKRARRPKKAQTLTDVCAGFLKKSLVPDLVARSKAGAVAERLQASHAAEKKAGRTAESFIGWRDQLLEQIGAAWILSVVFVRTLEDRGLVDTRRIAGPGAADSLQLFFELAPSLSVRDYLLTVFGEMARLPGARDVFDRKHNLAWHLSPSADLSRELLDLFREETEEGALRWRFEGSDTRFLGDLYQDLSEGVRKRYALLQTPDFVEEFILDETLDPAIETYGLGEVRVIDPTCGSGHFLLGAYDRLFRRRLEAAPGRDPKEVAGEALGQVYGADINPYAVAIARFRLTLSYLEKAGIEKLAAAPEVHAKVVVADSLLYGGKRVNLDFVERAEEKAKWGMQVFEVEDSAAAWEVFRLRFHAVVGNPPYITPKDSARRDEYRERYVSAVGKYALAAPFTERFFELAVDGGFVGMINANSFMKREFGKKLVEVVLPKLDLTGVIDSSGAFIPGHGTPTVILFGRNRSPSTDVLNAVLGRRGEPTTPANPAQGRVWSTIQSRWHLESYEDEYVTVTAIARGVLTRHPWTLEGGGAPELKVIVEQAAHTSLGDVVEDIGFASFTGLDDAFIIPRAVGSRLANHEILLRPMVTGETIRDWQVEPDEIAITPYDHKTHVPVPLDPIAGWSRFLWRFRTLAKNVASFGGRTRDQEGQNWWEWYRWQSDRYSALFRIAFGEVATHNHFVLDRGGKVLNRTAPIIKLPETATEDDHLALVGYLNSSTASFWMKQVAFNKGNRGGERGTPAEQWEAFYQFNGTKLLALPLPPGEQAIILDWTRFADECASLLSACEPDQVLIAWATAHEPKALSTLLEDARDRQEHLRGQLRHIQEELDWTVYAAFGLASVTTPPPKRLDDVPTLPKGQRPADRLYAQSVLRGENTRRYFELCDLPSPEQVVSISPRPIDEARLAAIADSPHLKLLEQPVYKRTYREGHRPWNALPALQAALVDRVEAWFRNQPEPAITSVNQLADALAAEARVPEIHDVLIAETGRTADTLAATLRRLLSDNAVPYLADLRFKPSGLEKHRQWQEVWDLQRREDAGEDVGDIPVPPKYASSDFARSTYWRLRGKLDVPKEAFIAYTGAERDDDPSPLYGWAAWNHLQRARALAALYQHRKTQDAWPPDRLRPLLTGLAELIPWLKQWHNEPEPVLGGRMGNWFEAMFETEARGLHLPTSS